ncbi:MAG: DUF2029 domain-containing protein [Thermodesulfovibrionales bacterium]|nr:DUF2029 domain-containing protein [Thermodesulfovibrionales bacterium]
MTFLVISVLVINAPLKRTVVPVYINAVDNWLHQKDLYSKEKYQYHYLPQFVFIYYPFYLMGTPFGDVVWRLISLGVFVTGIWLLVKALFYEQRYYYFFIITLLVVTPSIGALRNGQANLLFAGILLLIAYLVFFKRWWAVSFLLVFLTALKQTGLIITGFIVFAHSKVVLRTILFAVICLLMPFLFTNYEYAKSQYISAINEMTQSMNPTRSFADINGLLSLFGIKLQGLYSIITRAFVGLLTLALWLYLNRILSKRHSTMFFLILSSGYLMLFHPMTELNTYVIVAVPIAITALFLYHDLHLKFKAYVLMFICVTLGILPEMVRPIAPDLGMWYKPLAIIVTLSIVLGSIKTFKQYQSK